LQSARNNICTASRITRLIGAATTSTSGPLALVGMVGGPRRFRVHGAGAAWVVDAAGRQPYPAGAEIDFSLAAPRPLAS
jgi:hypothetical protein